LGFVKSKLEGCYVVLLLLVLMYELLVFFTQAISLFLKLNDVQVIYRLRVGLPVGRRQPSCAVPALNSNPAVLNCLQPCTGYL